MRSQYHRHAHWRFNVGPRRPPFHHRPEWHSVELVAEIRRPGYSMIARQRLIEGQTVTMEPITVSVGHTVTWSIVFLDQNGQPMLVTPTPDNPPQWSNNAPVSGTPPVDTLTPAGNGLTATDVANNPGTDNINVALSVGGKQFNATAPLDVTAAPQVLTSIALQGSVTS